jgi:aminoglycoside phosphotransferase (APT) family kinase protein
MIDGVLERLWPGGVESVEPLGGGITNHNLKVTTGGEAFVLRISGQGTELLGIDRRVELAASLAAAALGIGPEVVAFLEPEGYLVTRFVEGESGSVTVPEAAVLLLRFHSGPAIAGRFDSFRVVETYAATAQAAGAALPPGYPAASALAERIERRRGPYELAPCHNDLLAANFISGKRIWIVDWEYAGMGDAAFDLANFAVNNGLDEAGDRRLLDAHGGADPEVHVLLRYMSDFREAMWGVVQHAVSELDFDFAAYADEHFARLERTAGEPRFRAALG